MKNATQIIFRRLTTADFFNINKPKGSEPKGGGQSYIDLSTSVVRPADWESFFQGQKRREEHSGPVWRFPVYSLGLDKSQELEIGQRRPASYNIRSQKLGTKESNRVYAWHPNYSGFPAPKDTRKRVGVPNLVIYIVRTQDGQYWAGWFQAAEPAVGWQVDDRLKPMFIEEQGTIYFDPPLGLDETDGIWPYRLPTGPGAGAPVSPGQMRAESATVERARGRIQFKTKTEADIMQDLLLDDLGDVEPRKRQRSIEVLQRNSKVVAALKALYSGRCQISGEELTFKKRDGEFYSEAHHLIPLGEGGADSPYNIIIVSPLVHRMLHYATVSGLDLGKIKDNKLGILINGKSYTIKWHPKHAELVESRGKKPQ